MRQFPYKWIGLAGMSCTATVLWVSPLKQIFLDPNATVQHLQMMEFGAGFLFVLAHVVATVMGFPGSLLVIAGGAIFGVLWGTIWSVVGATMGAIAAFYLARYLLQDWIKRRFRHHPLLQRMNHTVCAKGLNCVFAVRFAPISPFTLVNFLFGLTPISLKPYALGTFFGIIPGTLVYTWVGATGQQALHGENVIGFAGALGLLVILSLTPLMMRTPQP